MANYTLRVYTIDDLTGLEQDHLKAAGKSQSSMLATARAYMQDPALDFMRIPASLLAESGTVWIAYDGYTFAVIERKSE